MKVLGISGKIGTGKTTLAELILGKVPQARKMAFADALRDEVAWLLGVSPQLVRMDIFKTMSFRIGSRVLSGREVLQWWGTEVRRAADPDYWVDQTTLALLKAGEEGCPLVVVDDVRFLGEALAVDVLVRLDPYPGWKPGPNAAHISETSLDLFPFTHRYSPRYGELEPLADELVREIMG